MFTPPSSPKPPRKQGDVEPRFDVDSEIDDEPPFHSPDDDRKLALGRKLTWAVVLLPLSLITVALFTRLFTHPAILDVLSDTNWRSSWRTTGGDWTPHKRHPANAPPGPTSTPTLSGRAPDSSTVSTLVTFPTQPISISSSTSSRPPTTTTSPRLPTVPTSQVDVPTPFPVPFDTSLQQNFSSVSCYNFFLNMTNSIPFRSCRPFSLLLQRSNAFIEAQNNITLLNRVIWGVCNTQLGEAQCGRNMDWFATSLQSSCTSDLNDRNAVVSSTLIALQAFRVMQSAGCLIDPGTSVYCYVEAAFNTNPSDLYFYQLPLGIPLPNSTTSTCSGCTKSVLALFAAALGDGTQAARLNALRTTYAPAARLANTECGQGYAAVSATGLAVAMFSRPHPVLWAIVGVLACWSLRV